MTTSSNAARKKKIAALATMACIALFSLVYGFAFPSAALAASDSATITAYATSADSSDPAAVASAVATTVGSTNPSFLTHYLVSPIALGFFLIYAASFVLYKTKRIRIATQRKIWNVLLLATFLVTGILGLLLAIQLDYTLPFTIPFNMLFWHVEAGIAMTLISLFHMGWHFNYYKNLLKSSRVKVRVARAAEKVSESDERQLVMEARAQRREKRENARAQREARRVDAAIEYAAARSRITQAPGPWCEPGA